MKPPYTLKGVVFEADFLLRDHAVAEKDIPLELLVEEKPKLSWYGHPG
eukprot:gene6019-7232_t